jgi:hypothetical protein
VFYLIILKYFKKKLKNEIIIKEKNIYKYYHLEILSFFSYRTLYKNFKYNNFEEINF